MKQVTPHFIISHTTRSYPTLPYADMKKEILGEQYELTLAFVGQARARALNSAYRGKDYVPNVLSFPLAEKCGEIYITPTKATTEASAFKMSPNAYIGYLFIHGLLHLKGLDHGSKMDSLEKKYRAYYKLR